MGSYLFKWPYSGAKSVFVSGNFDDWGKTAELDKVGETFEKEIDLPSADEKILYKFVVDDEWKTDEAAPKEDDGHFNVNNVLHPEQIKKKGASSIPGAAFISSAAPTSTTAGLAGGVSKEANSTPTPATISSAAPDSTTAGLAGQVERAKSSDSVPGAFPETPANEPESFGVAPIPASSGIGNPKPGEVTASKVESAATTSKEDYETAGQEGEKTFGVAPIPASSGVGNPKSGDVQASSIHDTATTSKEDYEKAGSSSLPLIGGIAAAAGVGAAGLGAAGAALFSKNEDKKNLIPESSLPMGEEAGKSADVGPTMSSAAPQSSTAALAAGVPLENKRQGMVIDPADAPSPEVKKEVSAVDKELLSKIKPSEATGEPASAANAQTSYYGLATSVPKPVEESMKEAHASPEAASDPSVVAEKSTLEKELLAKVPSTDGAGEPAPTIAAATSTTAPGTTASKTAPALGTSATAAAAVADGAGEEGKVEAPKITAPVEKTEGDATEYAPPQSSDAAPGVSPAAAAAVSDGTEDPTLAEEPAVKMMNQNEAAATSSTVTPAASSAVPTSIAPTQEIVEKPAGTPSKAISSAAGTTSTPTSATATPKKATESATSSPVTSATKDKKKKHRVSAFFKKIFD